MTLALLNLEEEEETGQGSFGPYSLKGPMQAPRKSPQHGFQGLASGGDLPPKTESAASYRLGELSSRLPVRGGPQRPSTAAVYLTVAVPSTPVSEIRHILIDQTPGGLCLPGQAP